MRKLVIRTFTTVALLGLLALNVATVTVPAVAAGVASTVGAIVGASSVLPEFRKVSYRGQSKRLTDAVADTTKRISKRTARGAARNVGSIAGEAIPIAGIAVVVGVTTWELKDACETMKDLRELELATNPDVTVDPTVAEVCGLEVPTKEQAWEAVKASPGQAWEKAKGYVPELPEWRKPDWPQWDMPEWEMPKVGDIWNKSQDEDLPPTGPDNADGTWTDRLRELNLFD